MRQLCAGWMDGCNHEKDVKEMYVKTFVIDHGNFKVARNGLVVDPEYLVLVHYHMGSFPVTVAGKMCFRKKPN